MQLESIKMQHPDAVIAIPTDDVQTGPAFQELSKMTRLVFLSNVPQNFSRNNYVSCISVNERENGTNTGRMIGEYLKENRTPKSASSSTAPCFTALPSVITVPKKY
ncbi:MAG: hypothetical protein ACLR8P_04965 [Clostridium fessum]